MNWSVKGMNAEAKQSVGSCDATETRRPRTREENCNRSQAISAIGQAEAVERMACYLEKVRFIQILWVSTGNYLLGLKSDGTLWKCTAPAGNPLVWTEV